MKKIRIIDLLNKIVNGEEVPKKIIVNCHGRGIFDELFEYDNEIKMYRMVGDNEELIADELVTGFFYNLTDEVEIVNEGAL